jgi:hypothetical protein
MVAAAILAGAVIFAIRSPSVSMTHIQLIDEIPAITEFSGRAVNLANTY